jgi:hypothetical protein
VPRQKELAEDVENYGGLQKILAHPSGLTLFCNQQSQIDDDKKKLYGEYASKERVQVENKIRNWGWLEGDEYQDILAGFGVWSAKQKALQENQPQPDPSPSSFQPQPDLVPSSLWNQQKQQSKRSSTSKSKPPSSVQFFGQPTPTTNVNFYRYREPKQSILSSDDESNKMSGDGTSLAAKLGKNLFGFGPGQLLCLLLNTILLFCVGMCRCHVASSGC